jgi:hypothetical protein
VTFATGWALAGLVLLAPLVVLHLRARGQEAREVPSLLLWAQLESDDVAGARRLRRPPLPLLLALQIIGLILLVVALADPTGSAPRSPTTQIVVLDNSFWMQPQHRLRTADQQVENAVHSTADSKLDIVLAAPAPSVIYQGSASGVAAALTRVRPTAAPADLGSALTVAAGLLAGPRDKILVVHAPEDSLPTTVSSTGELHSIAIGRSLSSQGIFSPSARCGLGPRDLCAVMAVVRNTGTSPAEVRYLSTALG